MFNDEILKAFISRFYGYGNYGARLWFIGMEEGGGGSPEQIARRLDAWDKRGRNELEDVVDYHREIGMICRFDERAKLSRTWSKLIRILLSSEGCEPSNDHVRDYQRTRLARTNGDSCLVELLPLPSPKTSHWLYYAKYSTLPFLKDRKTYKEHVRPQRVAHLRRRIEERQPRVVVFYSLSYLRFWEEVAGISLHPAEPDGTRAGTSGSTLFVVTKHPVARGVTNKYFHAVGKMIGSRVGRIEADRSCAGEGSA